jgi:hypothetical protein
MGMATKSGSEADCQFQTYGDGRRSYSGQPVSALPGDGQIIVGDLPVKSLAGTEDFGAPALW